MTRIVGKGGKKKERSKHSDFGRHDAWGLTSGEITLNFSPVNINSISDVGCLFALNNLASGYSSALILCDTLLAQLKISFNCV